MNWYNHMVNKYVVGDYVPLKRRGLLKDALKELELSENML